MQDKGFKYVTTLFSTGRLITQVLAESVPHCSGSWPTLHFQIKQFFSARLLFVLN